MTLLLGEPRVAVVGCGRMGKVRADACRRLGARVVALHDADPDAATALAATHPDARTFGDLHELPWPEVDAAIVCTPPDARASGVIAAVRAGIPVLMEKPVGTAAEAIAAELTLRPVATAVGYMNRYRQSVLRLREQVRNQTVFGVACHWVAGAYERDWWTAPHGGPLSDYATHLVDLCRFLIGEIREVRAVDRGTSNRRSGAVCLDFDNGACGTLFYSSEGSEKEIALNVFWRGGRARLEGWDFRASDADAADEVDPFVEETRAFLDSLADPSRSRVLCDFEDGRRTQEVIEAIARCLRHGR